MSIITPKHIFAAGLLLVVPIVGGLIWLGWQWQLLPPAVQAVARLLVIGVPLATLAALSYVGVTIVWRRWADHRYIEADKVIALTQAQRTFPDALTNLSYHDSRKMLPPLEQELVSGPQLLPPIPTFGELLDQGAIGPGRPLLLAYNAETRQPLTGSWNDLYSCGVGGMTGSGKSWLVAFLAGQSAAAGARIILVDPHAGDPESLSNRLAGLSASFMCDVAQTPVSIESAIKLAATKLENRRNGRGGTWPLLLICDEWTSLLRGRLGELLTATALDYAEQGRKFGCFALLSAQAWQVDAAGQVRDRLASHYVLRTRGDQFRYQTGLRSASAPADTLTLQAGQAYMLNVKGDLNKVVIPQMTPADITRLGLLIDKPAAAVGQPFGFTPSHIPAITAEVNGKSNGSQVEATTKLTSSAPATARMVSPEAARAAGLFIGGKSLPEIVQELRGVKSSEGGRRYQTALKEVEQLLREGMQR